MENRLESSEEIQLRKYRNRLMVSGMGILAFGIWEALKIIILFALNPSEVLKQFEGNDLPPILLLVIFWILMIIIILIVLLLNVYVGFCAYSEGKTRKKRNLYLLVAAIQAWSHLWSMYELLDPSSQTNQSDQLNGVMNTFIASMILELSSLFLLIQMFTAVIRVRNLGGNVRRFEGIESILDDDKKLKLPTVEEVIERISESRGHIEQIVGEVYEQPKDNRILIE